MDLSRFFSPDTLSSLFHDLVDDRMQEILGDHVFTDDHAKSVVKLINLIDAMIHSLSGIRSLLVKLHSRLIASDVFPPDPPAGPDVPATAAEGAAADVAGDAIAAEKALIEKEEAATP